MFRVVAIVLKLFLLMPGGGTRAGTPELCSVLLELKRLPNAMSDFHVGHRSSVPLLARVRQVAGALHDTAVADLFSTSELREIERYVNAADRQLVDSGAHVSGKTTDPVPFLSAAASAQLTELIGRQKCQKTTVAAGELAEVIGGASKRKLQSGFRWAELSSNIGLHMAVVAVLVFSIGLLVVTWLMTRGRRRSERHACHTKGLLVFGAFGRHNCVVTNVLNIGQGGAKLQAPSMDISNKELELYVAGHQIAASQRWANNYYVGLTFSDLISAEAVEEIVAGSRKEDQLGHLGQNATPCFYPGCHENCEKHRPTRIVLKQSSERDRLESQVQD